MKTTRIALACLLALLAALCLGVAPGLTRTITNTAQATWQRGAAVYSTVSNTVIVEVPSEPPRIDTFVARPGGAAITFTPPQCLSSPGSVTASPGEAATLNPASQLNAGEPLYFRITAASANSNPAAVDQIGVILSSPDGDREELTVFETEVNSGLFIGFIRTSASLSAGVGGDCIISAGASREIALQAILPGNIGAIAATRVEVLADPYGLVFDSENGQPLNGARVTLVNADTGQPAQVVADDGVTPWPSTVVTGQAVVDGAGRTHPLQAGEYRFPLVAFGRYRLQVEAPDQFSAPSTAKPEQIAALRRPGGQAFQISPASFGGEFTLQDSTAVRVDIPLDPAASALVIAKRASRQDALPGDAVLYSVTVRNADLARAKRGVIFTDQPSASLRLRPDSIRIDGVEPVDQVTVAPDGRQFSIALGTLEPGAMRTISYVMTVRADAPAGTVMNDAQVADDRGRMAMAGVAVRIQREDLASRMTLIGRITAGGCTGSGSRTPVAGVRVMLEDGSFAVTDADGRYHFSALVPGTHVVQVVPASLPPGSRLIDCARSTRSAGNAQSRFITGQGGSLAVADFAVAAEQPQPQLSPRQGDSGLPAKLLSEADAERKAAGADTDWLALGDGPNEFLFPGLDHNPRAPAVRVVIRHRVDQKVELSANGKPVDPIAFDGIRQASGGRFAVSIWRGIPLHGETTRLTAVVRNAKGTVVTELAREVHFAQGAARIELVEGKSLLVADGRSRPVLALRVLDRKGRPVRAGSTGEFQISAPYETAETTDSGQQKLLAGQRRAVPRWHVRGDDGMAYVELAPTLVSGKLSARFPLIDGTTRRHSQVEAWIVPGDQTWTVVGLAEVTAGAKSIANTMQRGERFASPLGEDARIAVYAKGPLAKGVLATAAYDSARQRDDHQLMGAVDPRAYYSVFADQSDRHFDAASRDRLYARIEGRGFTAHYGDFDTGFDQAELSHYQRVATGVKGEINRGKLHLQGFAAKISSQHRSDAFQGEGISGPYRLGSRAFIPGTETVAIEVRDRLRSELVISRRVLTRFVDYDIDLLSATITFKEPVQSRDFALNPQFIVIDYEVEEGTGEGELQAGLRGELTVADGRLRIGASAITEKKAPGADRVNLAAIDVTASLGQDTEVRAEIGTTFDSRSADLAWLVEAEHHDGKLDLLAYARSAGRDYGLGHHADAELGRRKFGLDMRYRATEALLLDVSSWRDDSLDDAGQRTALQVGASYKSRQTEGRLGLAVMHDRLADGRTARSTLLDGGVTQRLLDNRLELSASSSIALASAEAVDLPTRHRFTARYAVTPDVRLVGTYELAKGNDLEARSAQAGVEIAPWEGGRIIGSLGRQFGREGERSFAAFALSQSLPVTSQLTLSATLDSNRTLSGIDPARILNPLHPVSSGGQINGRGGLTEDFNAATLGAAWRSGPWSATLRGEWRDGEQAERKGLTLGAIRQLGEGSMAGAAFSWTSAKGAQGAATRIIDSAVALAHRPAASDFALLAKLEYRGDRVDNAVAGQAGPVGQTALSITGSGQSQRLIASLSGNWAPRSSDNGQSVQRHELGFFTAVRYNFDQLQGFDLSGTSLLGGLDLRYGIGPQFDLGLTGTLRTNLTDKTTAFAVGPQVGFLPAKDVLLTLGYNIAGFRDPDFAAARSTSKGLFVALRLKFDESVLGRVGLGQR